MPCHLISDAHERITDIPSVPIYILVNQQARERTCMDTVVKEEPVELDSSPNLWKWKRSICIKTMGDRRERSKKFDISLLKCT